MNELACYKCGGTPDTLVELALGDKVIRETDACRACLGEAMRRFEIAKSRFEAYRNAGLSREEANEAMIRDIENDVPLIPLVSVR